MIDTEKFADYPTARERLTQIAQLACGGSGNTPILLEDMAGGIMIARGAHLAGMYVKLAAVTATLQPDRTYELDDTTTFGASVHHVELEYSYGRHVLYTGHGSATVPGELAHQIERVLSGLGDDASAG